MLISINTFLECTLFCSFEYFCFECLIFCNISQHMLEFSFFFFRSLALNIFASFTKIYLNCGLRHSRSRQPLPITFPAAQLRLFDSSLFGKFRKKIFSIRITHTFNAAAQTILILFIFLVLLTIFSFF